MTRLPRLDWLLLAAVLALLVMSTLLVWSATAHRVDLTDGDSTAFLRKQLVNIVIGLVLMTAVTGTDHRWVRILAPLAYLASVGGLVLVLTNGATINGSRSWIQLGSMSVQPSEFAKLAVVVGDVVGRGIDAATTMSQLRSAIRALASAVAGPARLLEGLDGFVARVESARMATVGYAEIDLSTSELTYACAGHPPPLLAEPGGPPRYLLEGRSGALGSRAAGGVRQEQRIPLAAGSRLLLYTDGVTEARSTASGELFGAERLERLLADLGPGPDVVTAGVVDAVLAFQDGTASDDIAVLTLTPR